MTKTPLRFLGSVWLCLAADGEGGMTRGICGTGLPLALALDWNIVLAATRIDVARCFVTSLLARVLAAQGREG